MIGLRADEVCVQQTRVRAEYGVEIGLGHHGTDRRHLVHPERRDRVRVFVGVSDGCGEPAQRGRHPFARGLDRGALAQIDPRHAEVRGVREALLRHLAPLEGARQFGVGRRGRGCLRHVDTISYYPVSVNLAAATRPGAARRPPSGVATA